MGGEEGLYLRSCGGEEGSVSQVVSGPDICALWVGPTESGSFNYGQCQWYC